MQPPLRLAGAIWGHLVGDAMGVPYEFRPAEEIRDVRWGERGTHGKPPGTWSDDGALMLALLDSLLPDPWADPPRPGGFDTTDQAARFVRWAWEGAYTPSGEGRFDIGSTTSQALRRVREGAPAEEAGPADEQSQGNGSLMRILPIALVARDPVKLPELLDQAHRASRVTHGHVVPQAACALYVLLCRGLLRGETDRAFALTEARSKLRGWYARMPGGEPYLAALDVIDGWAGRSGRGYVVDSFWSAWDAFAGASSYRSTVERAVRYGRDTDTTACIAGAMAGIYWGLDGIPGEWLSAMRDRPQVARLVDRLLATAGYRTSSESPLRVDRVDGGLVPHRAGWTGRLGMLPLPGKAMSGLAGKHWRDLDADAAALAAAGVRTLLLLVPDHELAAARASGLGATLAANDVTLLRHPIADFGVPVDRRAFHATLAAIRAELRAGRDVGVACMGGLGRTGTVVACLLVEEGMDPEAAIALTRATRAHTIENADQESFVRGWGAEAGT
jgi:ADP-ribosylglycohydrolase/protein-tyrosine phosphatase